MPLVRKSKRLPRIPANVSLTGRVSTLAVVEARMGVFARAGCMASRNRTLLAVARRGVGMRGWGGVQLQRGLIPRSNSLQDGCECQVYVKYAMRAFQNEY